MHIHIHLPEYDSDDPTTPAKTDIINHIEELLDYNNLPTNIVQILGHPPADWSRGEPCPDCGHDEMYTSFVEHDIYYSNNGEFEFIEAAHSSELVQIECENCQTTLETTPVGDLL